jgi:hypothetical protein
VEASLMVCDIEVVFNRIRAALVEVLRAPVDSNH